MLKRDPTLETFGRNPARLRAEHDFSQDKLAEKAELDRTYISGIERACQSDCAHDMTHRPWTTRRLWLPIGPLILR
jgi:hypothetical protein